MAESKARRPSPLRTLRAARRRRFRLGPERARVALRLIRRCSSARIKSAHGESRLARGPWPGIEARPRDLWSSRHLESATGITFAVAARTQDHEQGRLAVAGPPRCPRSEFRLGCQCLFELLRAPRRSQDRASWRSESNALKDVVKIAARTSLSLITSPPAFPLQPVL